MATVHASLIAGVVVLMASSGAPAEFDVEIVAGQARVLLGVQYRFAEAAVDLPAPGHLPVTDSHDQKHGAAAYCYIHQTPEGPFQLELHDSDFGMHTGRILRVADAGSSCAPLESEPHFVVRDQRYALGDKSFSPPTGFKSTQVGTVQTFEMEWAYSDALRPHRLETCFSRHVTVRIEYDGGIARSVSVQNWEEPGC